MQRRLQIGTDSFVVLALKAQDAQFNAVAGHVAGQFDYFRFHQALSDYFVRL
jgi:hypothetical protein